jgi:Matrixin
MSTRTQQRVVLTLVAAAIVLAGSSARAYLKIGSSVGNTIVGIQWTRLPILYSITNRSVTGVSAQQLQTAASDSFANWTSQPNITLTAQSQGLTSAEPDSSDTLTVIGFQSHPEFSNTLGSTRFKVNVNTGEIVTSDIFLNSIFQWSVASGGETNRFDVESILTHEIGHLLGLGHSALGETQPRSGGGRTVLGKRAVMFPIAYGPASIEDRTLEADDIAGITDIYGNSDADRTLGGISGRVTLNGAGVFGAHVTAINISTSEMISGFSLNTQGDFAIVGMKPGIYLVRAEPLDDADLDGFFDEDEPVNLNFRVTYFSKHVAVPAGGSSGSIEVKVRAK